MRAGFLSGSKTHKPLQSGRARPVSDDVVPTADPAPVQAGIQRSTQPPRLTQEQWDRNFEECLQLLRGPNDESRFVGLLVASKLLHQGGDDALRKVLEAVGWDFLQRMLLPLVRTTNRPISMTEDQAQQQQMTTAVGLSVLAAMCRLPEVAASTQLQGLIPGLVRLLQAGSTARLLQTKPGHAASSSYGSFDEDYAATADWAALEDAIECLLAACSTQPHMQDTALLQPSSSPDSIVADAKTSQAEPGAPQAGEVQQDVVQQELLQQGGISKVLGGLFVGAPTHKWQPANMGVANAWRLPVLAVRMLCLLWPQHEAAPGSHHDAAVLSLVVVLCHYLGLPEILHSGTTAAAATAARKARAAARVQKQQQQQGPGPALGVDEQPASEEALGTSELQRLSDMDVGSAVGGGDVGGMTSSTDASSAAGGNTEAPSGTQAVQLPVELTLTEDAAVLQLQSLHALLLLLPDVLSLEAASSEGSALVDAIAMSETMPQQLQVEMQTQRGRSLAASGWGAAARRGLSWLLRGRSLGDDVRHAALQVCAHLARLLGGGWLLGGAEEQATRNAMLAVVLPEVLQVELGLLLRDVMAPHTEAISHTAHPAPSDKLLQELGQRQQQREQQGHQAVQSRPQLSESPDPLSDNSIASGTTLLSGQYTVGRRAAERLPAVLGLLEALIEGLAVASQADTEQDMEGVEEPSRVQQYHPPAPLVPLQVQERLMLSIGASVQLVLQFLQSVQEQLDSTHMSAATNGHDAATGSTVTSSASPPPEVLLACTRFLGHYLAEAPNALDEQVQVVLPVLLLAHPGLGRTAPAGGMHQSMEDLQDLAVQFLLPGLLQASQGTHAVASKLRQRLRQDHTLLVCLSAVLERALQRSSQAEQHTSQAGSAGTQNTAVEQEQQEQQQQGQRHGQEQQQQGVLLQTEKQVADVCMLLLNIMDIIGAPSGSLTTAQTCVVQVLLPVMGALAAWAQARVVSQPALRSQAPVGSTQQVQQLLQTLAECTLMPRTKLCTAALAAAVLQAHASMHGDTSTTTQDSMTAAGTGWVEADVQVLCSHVAVGVRLGLWLAVAVALEDMQPGSVLATQHQSGLRAQQLGTVLPSQHGAQHVGVSITTSRAAPTTFMVVSVQDVLEDFQGDAESCWEATALSAATSLHALPQLRAALQSMQPAGSTASQHTTPAGGDLFAQAQGVVAMQSMGWRMLAHSLS